MGRVYGKLINKIKFKCQLTFLVIFNIYEEDDEITSEIELAITSSITHNITQSELDNISSP